MHERRAILGLLLAACGPKPLRPTPATPPPMGCASPQICLDLAIKKMDEARDYWTTQRTQFLDVAMPIGAVISYASDQLPEHGWLACNGDEKSITRYPRLAALLGTTYGRATTPGNFRLPDYTGYFLRGWDPEHKRDTSARSPIVDGAPPTPWMVGTKQGDAVGSHSHHVSAYFGEGGTSTGAYVRMNATISPQSYATTDTDQDHTESRPKNMSVVYLIRADD